MRTSQLLILLSLPGLGVAGEPDSKPQATPEIKIEAPKADNDLGRRFGEAVGTQLRGQIKMLDMDKAQVIEGLRRAIMGETTCWQMDMKKLGPVLQARQREAQAKKEVKPDDDGKRWKTEQKLPESVHDEFYKAFVAMEGVKVTESGLAYKVLKATEGAHPKSTDTVRVHYTGRRTNGAIFDSSIERDEPTEFALNDVIKGWIEGVPLMSVGSTYRFVIPAELAYGKLGKESDSPPTGILLFDIVLLDIYKGDEKPGK